MAPYNQPMSKVEIDMLICPTVCTYLVCLELWAFGTIHGFVVDGRNFESFVLNRLSSHPRTMSCMKGTYVARSSNRSAAFVIECSQTIFSKNNASCAKGFQLLTIGPYGSKHKLFLMLNAFRVSGEAFGRKSFASSMRPIPPFSKILAKNLVCLVNIYVLRRFEAADVISSLASLYLQDRNEQTMKFQPTLAKFTTYHMLYH